MIGFWRKSCDFAYKHVMVWYATLRREQLWVNKSLMIAECLSCTNVVCCTVNCVKYRSNKMRQSSLITCIHLVSSKKLKIPQDIIILHCQPVRLFLYLVPAFTKVTGYSTIKSRPTGFPHYTWVQFLQA